MSRLCAKPTCSDQAVRWFDIVPAERRVVERTRATPSSIALCEAHAARFSAPDGWTVASDVVSDTVDVASDAAVPVAEQRREATMPRTAGLIGATQERTTHRKHDRDAPWFLAGSSSASTTPAHAPAPLLPTTDASNDADVDGIAPSAGSLLHRAFHGPDRDTDVARAKTADRDVAATGDDDSNVADVDDLSTRRANRSAPDTYDVELPFPPFEPARHVAVS